MRIRRKISCSPGDPLNTRQVLLSPTLGGSCSAQCRSALSLLRIHSLALLQLGPGWLSFIIDKKVWVLWIVTDCAMFEYQNWIRETESGTYAVFLPFWNSAHHHTQIHHLSWSSYCCDYKKRCFLEYFWILFLPPPGSDGRLSCSGPQVWRIGMARMVCRMICSCSELIFADHLHYSKAFY